MPVSYVLRWHKIRRALQVHKHANNLSKGIVVGFRFHQSFSIIPGLRLNISKSGLSASIGDAPFTLNISKNGLMSTASIPGTGLSYRHHIGHSNPAPPCDTSHFSNPDVPAPSTAPVELVHSANAELLTSITLQGLKDLIQTASKQYNEVSHALGLATDEEIEAASRYDSWNHGYLFKRVFRKAFEKRRHASIDTSENVAKLHEQLSQSKITTHIEIDKGQADLFDQVVNEFTGLCDSKAIWDICARLANDVVRQRTIAGESVNRVKVLFDVSRCDLIDWDRSVPHLNNSKGGELYLYPGFVLYRAARETFSLIEHNDVGWNARSISFLEVNKIPSDARVTGHIWAKANEDGSRDKRFANNYELPLVQYGELRLTSAGGLNEEFQFSNWDKLVHFVQTFKEFTSSFATVVKK
jgi:Protein of unknown function (DUF4236)